MNKRQWLNLALLAAVAALALVAYYKPLKSEPQQKLSVLKAADAKNISIEIAGNPPVVLERTAADWRLTAPLAARADASQVERLLEILDATSKDRYPAAGLARYELNEPYARIKINQQAFAFGAVNQMSREQYVLTGDGIYPVSLRYGAVLPKTVLQLVSPQLFAPDEAPVAFDFGAFRLAQEDGKWQLVPPATDASQDDLNRWVDDWRLATAPAAEPPDGGKPLMTVRIKLKTGSEVAVAVLQREQQFVVKRSDQPFAHRFSAAAGQRLFAKPAANPAPK